MRGGAEYDVLTCWRRHLKFTQRPGVCSSVKRGYRRRERRFGRDEAREGELTVDRDTVHDAEIRLAEYEAERAA